MITHNADWVLFGCNVLFVSGEQNKRAVLAFHVCETIVSHQLHVEMQDGCTKVVCISADGTPTVFTTSGDVTIKWEMVTA